MTKVLIYPRSTRVGGSLQACLEDILRRGLGVLIATGEDRAVFEIDEADLPIVIDIAALYDCDVREIA